ncbi:spore coat protein [Domibacillus indicus]|uniref:spore coat protein n=1 Tax=Domibacillus indicus TaxID=1437523 RepID=UPI00203C419E|nr:spore coat protein [Domibacillus indicus]MCM3789049.1 spore coat protein [Domibacillus indicus]
MPFGAHETLEVHEILLEKVNMITHFNLYLQEAQNPELRDLIMRHRQEEIRSYDEIVAYTHDYNAAAPVPPMTNVKGVSPQNIQYGLNNPPQVEPRTGAALGDTEIASAVLCAHKNAAKNGMWAALETADPNLRRMLLNSAANCANQAYEVFLFMNKQGTYQIPKMSSHTAKTYLHTYQPAGQAFQNQYSAQPGFSGHTPGAGGGMNQNFNPASQQSNFYGGLQGNRNAQYGMNGNLPNQGMQGYSK